MRGRKEERMEYSPKRMNELLVDKNFHFKKNFGQNFIVDENSINAIVQKAEIPEDTLVMEIGPGAGSLTYKLSFYAKEVLCYEIDTSLQPILEQNLKEQKNVTIIYDDFLKRDVLEDLKNFSYRHLFVIANLPYYITTPILIKFIEDKIPVDKIVVMVQKEVGDRFKADVNTKDYNSLSIFLNYYFHISKLMDISRNVFIPKPNVDSIVLSFQKRETLLPVKNYDLFFTLIRDSFKQKRKTIRNNLKNYDLSIIEEVLKKNHFDLNTRAEQIPIDVFVDMANALEKNVSN